jgi:hypothetical protein
MMSGHDVFWLVDETRERRERHLCYARFFLEFRIQVLIAGLMEKSIRAQEKG